MAKEPKAKIVNIPSRKFDFDESIKDLLKKMDEHEVTKSVVKPTYEEYDNKDEPILYIILNEDAICDEGVKLTAISHLTSMMASNFRVTNSYFGVQLVERNQRLWKEWLDSFGGYGNTVILSATEDDLYTHCMSNYDNVEFVKYIDDSERVAHHNWKLDLPQHLGVAFFGIKSEMPKWIRKLPLYKN